MNQIEENITKSFHLAKKDIYGLYVHVRNLYAEVQTLKGKAVVLRSTKSLGVAALTTLVASKISTTVHAGNCAYAKNIKNLNRISFMTTADARSQGYALCACVR